MRPAPAGTQSGCEAGASTLTARPETLGLCFKRHPASVRDADTFNHERHTSASRHGLGHDSCELREYKAWRARSRAPGGSALSNRAGYRQAF
jgi:hypothetical protein